MPSKTHHKGIAPHPMALRLENPNATLTNSSELGYKTLIRYKTEHKGIAPHPIALRLENPNATLTNSSELDLTSGIWIYS